MAFWHDVRHGFRLLAASPTFTAAAALSLDAGIGANRAIFSFADALLLRPLVLGRALTLAVTDSSSASRAVSAPAHC